MLIVTFAFRVNFSLSPLGVYSLLVMCCRVSCELSEAEEKARKWQCVYEVDEAKLSCDVGKSGEAATARDTDSRWKVGG